MIQYFYFDLFARQYLLWLSLPQPHVLRFVAITTAICLSVHCSICWWCLLLPPFSLRLLLFLVLTDDIVRYLCIPRHQRAAGWKARQLLVTFLLIFAMLNFHSNSIEVAATIAVAPLTLHGSYGFFHVNCRKHIRAFATHINTNIYLILFLYSGFYGKIMIFSCNCDTHSRTHIKLFIYTCIELTKCNLV